jgi:hypothetical protein
MSSLWNDFCLNHEVLIWMAEGEAIPFPQVKSMAEGPLALTLTSVKGGVSAVLLKTIRLEG